MHEATISISRPDGSMTPPVPVSVAKKALDVVEAKGRKKAARTVAKEAAGAKVGRPSSAQQEAFSEKETGESSALGVARDQLRAFLERIERLEEEKKTIADDIKDVYGEAKGVGFDTKILRKVIQIRKQDPDERAEQEAILDTYLHALGMIERPAED